MCDTRKCSASVCAGHADGAIEIDGVSDVGLDHDALTAFAKQYLDDDCAVALEATTNTWAVVDVLAQYCPNVVVSNPMRTKMIASASIKTDKVDAQVLAQWSGAGRTRPA